ncbi:hypothetical protein Taro_028805 [Colocasia esculenta]|uniref:Uncharacterized protein n=1 Tax=Colocasia esculenta TaxID=4460 RepID=A0A843VC87_COLES|nr:hypothetical protein [Colocasia esculenta]
MPSRGRASLCGTPDWAEAEGAPNAGALSVGVLLADAEKMAWLPPEIRRRRGPPRWGSPYEAWVIYNFLSLCLAWVGGPGAVLQSLSGQSLKPSWCLMTCCFPAVPLDGDLLRPFNPIPKFLLIKSVVFLTYWQGVLVFLTAKSGFLKDADEAADFQNFILCLEMLVAALGHLYAFPYKEYASANLGTPGTFRESLTHALKFNDFYHDTVHQFAPTYHEYVLYNISEGDEGSRKYRSRMFVPTLQEMDSVRQNKPMIGGKLDDIEISPNDSSNLATRAPGFGEVCVDEEAISTPVEPYDIIEVDLANYPAKVVAVDDSS